MSDHVELGAPSSRAPESAFELAELFARVEQSLARVVNSARWSVLTWAVPRVASERLLNAESEGEALLWAAPGEGEMCALGAAFTLTASGNDRFQAIQQRAREVWPLLDASAADRNAPEPCFFGGFAFQAGRAASALWQDFGDARFVLPRLSYLKTQQGAWLRLIAPNAELSSPERRAALNDQLRRASYALFAPNGASQVSSARVVARDERSPESWATLLADIQA
ncbi:MAG TPA: hypothetical protein VGM29_10105, partial [Polyangiaceae bacterium]